MLISSSAQVKASEASASRNELQNMAQNLKQSYQCYFKAIHIIIALIIFMYINGHLKIKIL